MVFIQKSFSVIGQFLKLLGGTTHSLHVKSSLIGQWGLLSAKLWEGNVFTNVCLSTGGYAISWLAAWSHFPSGYIPPGGLPGGFCLQQRQVQGLPPRGGGDLLEK